MADEREVWEEGVVHLSPAKFLAGCSVAALVVLVAGRSWPPPSWLAAAEVLATVVALFVFGSIRYRLDKNALTYGAAMVVVATAWWPWWASSSLKTALAGGEAGALWDFIHRHFLTFHGLDGLVHLDTMLFILGLTFFVACVAQTRLLETASFAMLGRFKGKVVPTVLALSFIVSFLSGILDGVSMIGLMIRTLIIILALAGTVKPDLIYAVMVSTVITTVCGMWLAYGEPPNLIMKANLHPVLDDAFFLRYCMPAALGSWIVVAWNISRKLKGRRVDLKKLDVLDRHVADVRFLQAARHGEVFTPLEFAEKNREALGGKHGAVVKRLLNGVPLGEAMVDVDVPKGTRLALLGQYAAENLAETLDDYYLHVFGRNDGKAKDSASTLERALESQRKKRLSAQRTAALAFIPFIGLLVAHAVNHDVPLFLSSFAGFGAALMAVWPYARTRALALREAAHEYHEYLFLFPLFLSITVLQKSGFFAVVADLLRVGIERLGASHMAFAQLVACTGLSALLDNNVVADFAGRALKGLEVGMIHLFAMAQIAGYALGGCWTHIGSAQSVVAYSFIRKELDPRYTPFAWIKAMTVLVVEIGVWMAVLVYAAGWLSARV
jgi:Na+/H+ antiporter NhaD/arsenite permease-like protein